MLGLAEHNGLPDYGIHAFGIFFLIGRLCHAYALLNEEVVKNGKVIKVSPYRIRGIQTTLISYLALAAVLLVQFVLETFQIAL
jgi:uncharacterized membrane protein YecN with MAPEG domain